MKEKKDGTKEKSRRNERRDIKRKEKGEWKINLETEMNYRGMFCKCYFFSGSDLNVFSLKKKKKKKKKRKIFPPKKSSFHFWMGEEV